jgi:threonine/homoserine/homoserine lactone efflux protein
MIPHLITLVIPWAIISLSGVMAPGPISTMAISEGVRQGFRAGPLISVGHAITEVVMVVALAVGLGRVLQHPSVAGVTGLLGGLVLLWMGQGLMRSAWRWDLGLDVAQPQGSPSATYMSLVSAGILLSVFNPYWLVWWATVGSANMLRFLEYGLLGLVVFYVSHIALDFGWTTFLSVTARSGRHVIGDGVFRIVLLVCGVALVFFGIYFVSTGVSLLRG